MRHIVSFAAAAVCLSMALAGSLNYSVLREKIYDAPVKTQIEQHIVVQRIPSEQNLKSELLARYHAAVARRGFRYHNPATNIFIFIYATQEQANAEQGGWIGMVAQTFGESKPSVSINKGRLAALSARPTVLFGLSEAERKKVFREIAAAEDRAANEARSSFPDSQFKQQIDFQRKLETKYKSAIARRHHLAGDQMLNIVVEGVKMGWAS